MAKNVLLDEFHLSYFAPNDLTPAQFDAIRRTLDDARFHAAMRLALRQVVRRFPSLDKVRFRLSR